MPRMVDVEFIKKRYENEDWPIRTIARQLEISRQTGCRVRVSCPATSVAPAEANEQNLMARSLGARGRSARRTSGKCESAPRHSH